MFTSNRNSDNFNTDLAYMSLPHIYVILGLWPCSFKFVLSILIHLFNELQLSTQLKVEWSDGSSLSDYYFIVIQTT